MKYPAGLCSNFPWGSSSRSFLQILGLEPNVPAGFRTRSIGAATHDHHVVVATQETKCVIPRLNPILAGNGVSAGAARDPMSSWSMLQRPGP